MKIELNAGGIGGGMTINAFQSDFNSFVSKSENVISSFKAVKKQVYNTSGGVGSLQGSLDQIQSRITREEKKKTEVESVRTIANSFVELAVRVDKQVATLVDQNKEAFYTKYPHLRPPGAQDEKAWYDKAWEWLCDKGEEISDSIQAGLEAFVGNIKEGWNWICDGAKKLWNSAVAFYLEHKEIIDLIGKVLLTAVIIIGAVVAIVGLVGAGLAALVPILTALGISATVAAAISAAVVVTAIVSTAGAAILDVIDLWAEIDHPVFNAFQTGLNIVSFVTDGILSIGAVVKAIQKKALSKSAAVVSTVDNVADTVGTKTYHNAAEIAANNPDAVKYIPMEDMGTTVRTPAQTELKSATMLDDGFRHQVTIDADMNITRYGTKGAIRPDHIKAYDNFGNVIDLDEVADVKQVAKFEIVEDKNYRIQYKGRQRALWKNILDQSNNRIEYLAQHGAIVEQIYRIDLAGHGKISLGEISDLYQKIMDTVPPNVNIEWIYK